MDKTESEFIRRSFAEYQVLIATELARHPGGELDDVDIALVRDLVNQMRLMGRSGLRLAHYEPGMVWGRQKPIWINGGPNLVKWIRNQQFRPRVSAIADEAHRLGMIPAPNQTVEGGVAEQRRQITAPSEYTARSLQNGRTALLGAVSGNFLPAPPPRAEAPSWLAMFPSRDDGGPLDVAIMTCLLHMSDARAVETIQNICRDRERMERESTDNEIKYTEKMKARRRREQNSEDNPAVVMLRLWREKRV
jgi:hypothetical protein